MLKRLIDIFKLIFKHIPAGPLEHHPEGDLFSHSVIVMDRVRRFYDAPEVLAAAFLHDVGKILTDPALYPHHYGHDKVGGELARKFMLEAGFSCIAAEFAAIVAEEHMRFRQGKKGYIPGFEKANRIIFGGGRALAIISFADGNIIK